MKLSKSIRFIALLSVLFFTSFGSALAQGGDVRRTFGLTGSLQSNQMAILVPIWAGDVTIIAPGISLNYIENTTTTIGLFVAPRFFIEMTRVAPYVGAQGGIILNMPNFGSDTTDLLLGLVFGGEYFVNPKFSFGVEAQLNGFVNDASGARIIQISTDAGVHANVYF